MIADRIRRAWAAWRGRSEDLSTVRVLMTDASSGGVAFPVAGDAALKQATVWACVGYLSRTVAQLPWRVLREDDSGVGHIVATHPVARLLSVRPHADYTPFGFKELMVARAALRGNAVAVIHRNGRGEPESIEPVHPDRVSFERDDAGRMVYMISMDDGSREPYSADNIMHIRGFGDGAVGLDVASYAAGSVGWARATEIFGTRWFANGTNPSGVLAVKRSLTPEGKRVLEEELAQKYQGAANGSRTLIVDGDMDYRPLLASPEAAQLLETRQHQVEEVCRWFGVPPHKVMHLLRATFSNIEHQSIEVVVDSITPWCLRLEQEADYKLLNSRRSFGLYTKLDTKGLLRGDYKSRQEGLQIMRRNGVITADQWAALEDMPPPGAANGGDKYIVEGNMVELSRVGEQAAGGAPLPEPDDVRIAPRRDH